MSASRSFRLAAPALLFLIALVLLVDVKPIAAQTAAPASIWRFMGIPQGIQKIRDVSTNRSGNRPDAERKPPIKRLADPENLESKNPAIKAAAEIKTAEDEKKQKVKAIKYLATIGCSCYDKDGKVTEALLAATDDCTPDVRKAAVEAIEDAAGGECCRACGSTSCCNEKVTKRLSEMAYERDDSGCCLEPNADVRKAARKALVKCCPGGPPRGPIEEDVADSSKDSEIIPTPVGEEDKDEGKDKDAEGESREDDKEAEGEQQSTEKASDKFDASTDEESGDSEDGDAKADPFDNDEAGVKEKIPASQPSKVLTLRNASYRPTQSQSTTYRMTDTVVTPASAITFRPSQFRELDGPVIDSRSLPRGPTTQPSNLRPVSKWTNLADDDSIPSLRPVPARLTKVLSASAVTTQSNRATVAREARSPRLVATVYQVHPDRNIVVLECDQLDLAGRGSRFVIHQDYATGKTVIGEFVIKEIRQNLAFAVATTDTQMHLIQEGQTAISVGR